MSFAVNFQQFGHHQNKCWKKKDYLFMNVWTLQWFYDMMIEAESSVSIFFYWMEWTQFIEAEQLHQMNYSPFNWVIEI